MTIRKILILVGAMMLVGCVHVEQKPLAKDSVATLAGKSIDYTEYEKPGFVATTAGKAMFGAIGAVAMVAAGNQIIKENDVPDPSISISHQVMDLLVAQHGMKKSDHHSDLAESDDVGVLSLKRKDVDYLLDVKTVGWSFVYFPTNWVRYRVFYTTRMRLIDTAQQQIVASTLCGANPVIEADAPTKDELLSDKAKLLKTYLQKSANDCTTILSRDFLQLQTPDASPVPNASLTPGDTPAVGT
jgi:hypothetical protein